MSKNVIYHENTTIISNSYFFIFESMKNMICKKSTHLRCLYHFGTVDTVTLFFKYPNMFWHSKQCSGRVGTVTFFQQNSADLPQHEWT